MFHQRNLPFYAAAVAVFAVMKWLLAAATTNQLLFLLWPTNQLVSIGLNSSYEFIDQSGYYHGQLQIIIEKSCAGYNFWSLCFLLLCIPAIHYFKGSSQKILAMLVALPIACLLTWIANASRIILSVLVQRQLDLRHLQSPHWLHEAEGSFIYLSYLILIYTAANLLVKKFQHSHAQMP